MTIKFDKGEGEFQTTIKSDERKNTPQSNWTRRWMISSRKRERSVHDTQVQGGITWVLLDNNQNRQGESGCRCAADDCII